MIDYQNIDQRERDTEQLRHARKKIVAGVGQSKISAGKDDIWI